MSLKLTKEQTKEILDTVEDVLEMFNSEYDELKKALEDRFCTEEKS